MNRKAIVAALACAALPAYAQESPAARSLAATCAACHGTDGRSVAQELASLAGLPREHIRSQMRAFRDGTHPGSVRAIGRYLARTSSGHFLLQAVIAGLVLLFAFSPRPILPRDPVRIARRSPLEHADALGHAYADVDATRTATARLVWGLRRRAGRLVGTGNGISDDAFLAAVVQRHPDLYGSVTKVRTALHQPIGTRDFVAVGDVLREIERHLTSSLITTS